MCELDKSVNEEPRANKPEIDKAIREIEELEFEAIEVMQLFADKYEMPERRVISIFSAACQIVQNHSTYRRTVDNINEQLAKFEPKEKA